MHRYRYRAPGDSIHGLAERSLHADEAVLLALLVAILVGFGLALRRPRRTDLVWSVVLLVLAAAWLALDAPFEGRTLWSLDARHGLTTGDLQSLPAIVEALVLGVRALRFRRVGARGGWPRRRGAEIR